MVGKSEIVAEFTGIESALDRYHDAVARNRGGRLDAIAAAIDGGHTLNWLREQSQHGDWAAWVEREGQTLRTVHNWRKLAETGLTAEQVVEQGGMIAVLRARSATRPTDEFDDMESSLVAINRMFEEVDIIEKWDAFPERIEQLVACTRALEAERTSSGIVTKDMADRAESFAKDALILRREMRALYHSAPHLFRVKPGVEWLDPPKNPNL